MHFLLLHAQIMATVEEVAYELHQWLWPNNSDGYSAQMEPQEHSGGRSWADYATADAEVRQYLTSLGGCSAVLQKQKKSDGEHKRLVRVKYSCDKAGKYRHRPIDTMSVDNSRKTTTKKTECPVVINLRVAQDGERFAYHGLYMYVGSACILGLTETKYTLTLILADVCILRGTYPLTCQSTL